MLTAAAFFKLASLWLFECFSLIGEGSLQSVSGAPITETQQLSNPAS
jgi:hypothetical protein